MSRTPACPFLGATLLLVSLARAAGPGPYSSPSVVCRFADPRINESSGIASASRSDGYFFTHNDSGDRPRFFAVSRKGVTLAAFTLTGARAIDWEDMARGPDQSGRSCLFLGDIGDNEGNRPNVTIYRVSEPAVDPGRPGATRDAGSVARFELQYPDGAHNAETLLIHPRTGQLFIVTKGSREPSGVYAAPLRLRQDGMNPLSRVAEIRFSDFRVTSGAGRDPIGAVLATGGAISPDGRRVIVRTYPVAYEWAVPGGDIARAFASKPARVPMPDAPGGEAVTYRRDGRAILVSTEGEKAPVHELRRR